MQQNFITVERIKLAYPEKNPDAKKPFFYSRL
jgi:hypothetical protein